MVVATWRWPLRRVVVALFALCAIGQALFKRADAPAFFARHAVLIWAVVIVYKLKDAYVTHVANVDRFELLGRLSGGWAAGWRASPVRPGNAAEAKEVVPLLDGIPATSELIAGVPGGLVPHYEVIPCAHG
ncbi:MAG: hypothetical protein OXC71_09080 [Chloroflexi bacterium]|nr:hypothetical protein [Chloroflexota bacterium]